MQPRQVLVPGHHGFSIVVDPNAVPTIGDRCHQVPHERDSAGVVEDPWSESLGPNLGIGALLPFVAKTDAERRVLINIVGPVWEGNQVWLILGGGAIFAAWPALYAVSFSGFYLAMIVILLALILRPVGFKFRGKIQDPRWRATWDWALFVGGAVPDGPGAYYPPTVLDGCTPDMEVMTEETFGPVAAVTRVPDFATALELADGGAYGLAATVLTPRLDHATAAVERLDVGTVKVNAVFGGAPGGSADPRGASGSGVGYGPDLLLAMTQLKAVHIEPAVTP